jgi:hypothetical protein
MLRCFAAAIVIIMITVGFADSETFIARITKVEGNKVTYEKATYTDPKPWLLKGPVSFDDPVTVEATKNVAVTMGPFSLVEGRPTSEGRIRGKTEQVGGGLSSIFFQDLPDKAKTRIRPSLITIADKGEDKGKITAINLWSSASPK